MPSKGERRKKTEEKASDRRWLKIKTPLAKGNRPRGQKVRQLSRPWSKKSLGFWQLAGSSQDGLSQNGYGDAPSPGKPPRRAKDATILEDKACSTKSLAAPKRLEPRRLEPKWLRSGPYYDTRRLVYAKKVLHTVRAQTAEATTIGTRVAKPKAGTVTSDPGIAPQTEKCKADAGRKLNATAQSTPHIKHRPCIKPPACTAGRPG